MSIPQQLARVMHDKGERYIEGVLMKRGIVGRFSGGSYLLLRKVTMVTCTGDPGLLHEHPPTSIPSHA